MQELVKNVKIWVDARTNSASLADTLSFAVERSCKKGGPLIRKMEFEKNWKFLNQISAILPSIPLNFYRLFLPIRDDMYGYPMVRDQDLGDGGHESRG